MNMIPFYSSLLISDLKAIQISFQTVLVAPHLNLLFTVSSFHLTTLLQMFSFDYTQPFFWSVYVCVFYRNNIVLFVCFFYLLFGLCMLPLAKFLVAFVAIFLHFLFVFSPFLCFSTDTSHIIIPNVRKQHLNDNNC